MRKIRRHLAGIAAGSAEERVAAKVVLSELLLSDLRENPAVPYEEDEVTPYHSGRCERKDL